MTVWLMGLQRVRHDCATFTFHFPWWLSGKESPANAGDVSLIPGFGRSIGEGNGNLL